MMLPSSGHCRNCAVTPGFEKKETAERLLGARMCYVTNALRSKTSQVHPYVMAAHQEYNLISKL